MEETGVPGKNHQPVASHIRFRSKKHRNLTFWDPLYIVSLVNGQKTTGHKATILLGQKVTIHIFLVGKILKTISHNQHFQ